MPPSDTTTNATDADVERMAQAVTGTASPSDSDLCDWSKGHTIIDWPVMLLNDAFIILGVGVVVWLLLRRRQ